MRTPTAPATYRGVVVVAGEPDAWLALEVRVGDGDAEADGGHDGPMVRFGFHLGAAFRIQDDLLNLVGDEALYGKEINGDLREGKRTLVLVHLAQHARGADRVTVDRYLHLRPDERTPGVIADVRALIDAYGSIEFTRAYAAGIAGAATDAFEAAFAGAAPGPDTEFVRALVPYMLDRGR